MTQACDNSGNRAQGRPPANEGRSGNLRPNDSPSCLLSAAPRSASGSTSSSTASATTRSSTITAKNDHRAADGTGRSPCLVAYPARRSLAIAHSANSPGPNGKRYSVAMRSSTTSLTSSSVNRSFRIASQRRASVRLHDTLARTRACPLEPIRWRTTRWRRRGVSRGWVGRPPPRCSVAGRVPGRRRSPRGGRG